jgi:ABC-type transport system involved in cytochrome c biogenesis permease component
MFDWLLKNYTLLWVLLILGVTMGIVAIILGVSMEVTPSMIASIILCVFSIIFIAFSGYNLMYHPKLTEQLSSDSDESLLSTFKPEGKTSGGYFYYD